MNKIKTVAFAGGCFWCTEAVFKMIKGVMSVVPGYTGGTTDNPDYERVHEGNTGHAESIKIEYNEDEVAFEDLLIVFFYSHDPTTLNRQGSDIGTQYRSAIFYSDEAQKEKIEKFIKDLKSSKAYDNPIVTEVKPLGKFYEAEYEHKDYYANNKENMYCQLVIAPKVQKIEQRFQKILKDNFKK